MLSFSCEGTGFSAMVALLPASALNDVETGETYQEVNGNKWEAVTF